MAVLWTKELYDLAYSFPAEPDGHPNTRPGVRLHYNRAVLYPEMVRRAQQLVQLLGLTTADRILIAGCGFGWTVEALVDMGFSAVGTDVSAFIQDNKAVAEDGDIAAAISAVGLDPTSGEGATIFSQLKGNGIRTRGVVLNEDSQSVRSRNTVKQVLGEPTVIITEDLVTSLSDNECAALQSALTKYVTGVRIVHFLTEFANPAAPFNFNSKSISEWKAVFPTSTIIADGYRFRVA